MIRETERRICCFHLFTLVELLVVVTIITILAALLLPVLGGARRAARNTVCINNQRQIGTAFAAYHEDNRQLPTPADVVYPYGSAPNRWGNSRTGWDIKLAELLGPGIVESLWCPENHEARRSTVISSFSGTSFAGRRSYAMPIPRWHGVWNDAVLRQRAVAWLDFGELRSGSKSFAQIRDTAGTAMLVEHFDTPLHIDHSFGSTWGTGIWHTGPSIYGMDAYPHRNRSNYLFTDGHVESMPLSRAIGDGIPGYFITQALGVFTDMPGD
ncbi:MAG: DUF1559 domain-containing protein [Lentisphaerae bacterium]|nr:MAG: DUF1559 domain-containing protein [Lentisphaerota bacterium]